MNRDGSDFGGFSVVSPVSPLPFPLFFFPPPFLFRFRRFSLNQNARLVLKDGDGGLHDSGLPPFSPLSFFFFFFSTGGQPIRKFRSSIVEIRKAASPRGPPGFLFFSLFPNVGINSSEAGKQAVQ